MLLIAALIWFTKRCVEYGGFSIIDFLTKYDLDGRGWVTVGIRLIAA